MQLQRILDGPSAKKQQHWVVHMDDGNTVLVKISQLLTDGILLEHIRVRSWPHSIPLMEAQSPLNFWFFAHFRTYSSVVVLLCFCFNCIFMVLFRFVI